VDLSPFRFLSVGTLKALSFFQVHLKMKRHALVVHVIPFSTSPGPSKVYDSPWSHVPMRALIQVEGILGIFLWIMTWWAGTI